MSQTNSAALNRERFFFLTATCPAALSGFTGRNFRPGFPRLMKDPSTQRREPKPAVTIESALEGKLWYAATLSFFQGHEANWRFRLIRYSAFGRMRGNWLTSLISKMSFSFRDINSL